MNGFKAGCFMEVFIRETEIRGIQGMYKGNGRMKGDAYLSWM